MSIKNWKEDERPREKLVSKGAEALSDSELIAIILRTGTRELSALDLARIILAEANNDIKQLSQITFDKISKIKGIGHAKAVSIITVLEMSRRISIARHSPIPQIYSSESAANMIAPLLQDLSHEEFWVMYLNRGNRLISKERLSSGGISATIVDVKIVIKRAIEKLASSIIMIHNHPSGNTEPGEQDKRQTKMLKEAAYLFDISLLDHIIISNNGYFSFSDNGLI